jgi:hypothetical protein
VPTWRRHEFFVARSEFQCSSSVGPISQSNNFVFSSSVQCLEPCTASTSKGSSVSLRLFPGCVLLLAIIPSDCLRLGPLAAGFSLAENSWTGDMEELAIAWPARGAPFGSRMVGGESESLYPPPSWNAGRVLMVGVRCEPSA